MVQGSSMISTPRNPTATTLQRRQGGQARDDAGGGAGWRLLGFQYDFSFEEGRNEDDLLIERDGATVVVDSTVARAAEGGARARLRRGDGRLLVPGPRSQRQLVLRLRQLLQRLNRRDEDRDLEHQRRQGAASPRSPTCARRPARRHLPAGDQERRRDFPAERSRSWATTSPSTARRASTASPSFEAPVRRRDTGACPGDDGDEQARFIEATRLGAQRVP